MLEIKFSFYLRRILSHSRGPHDVKSLWDMVSLLVVATKIMVEGCPLDSPETIPTTGGSWDGRDHQSHICCTTHVPQPLRDGDTRFKAGHGQDQEEKKKKKKTDYRQYR